MTGADTNCDLYKVLGLSRDASQDDIKRAFKKLALQHHPDKKAGDDTEFKRINEAYQILSDPDKRKVYDMQYEDNINVDLLGKFASILMNIVHDKLKEKMASCKSQASSAPSQAQTQAQSSKVVEKPEPLVLKVSVTVEELYNAKVKKIVVKVKRRSEDGQYVFKSKSLYISLLNYRDQYRFENQGDDSGDGNESKRGDIIVKLDILPDTNKGVTVDTLFCRYDLHIEHKMTLYQYLYGLDVKLPYYNNDTIAVIAQPYTREYLQDDGYYNYVHEVNDKGLPFVDGGDEKGESNDDGEDRINRGKLYVYFKLHINKVPTEELKEQQNFFRAYFNGTHEEC